jgi:hypothetical protein
MAITHQGHTVNSSVHVAHSFIKYMCVYDGVVPCTVAAGRLDLY